MRERRRLNRRARRSSAEIGSGLDGPAQTRSAAGSTGGSGGAACGSSTIAPVRPAAQRRVGDSALAPRRRTRALRRRIVGWASRDIGERLIVRQSRSPVVASRSPVAGRSARQSACRRVGSDGRHRTLSAVCAVRRHRAPVARCPGRRSSSGGWRSSSAVSKSIAPDRRRARGRTRACSGGMVGAGDLGQTHPRAVPPEPATRRPHSISCISAARLKTSARTIPGAPAHPFRRGVRAPHRRGDADPLERARDAEAGQPRLVGRQQDVARMQRAVRRCGPPRRQNRARRPAARRRAARRRRRRSVVANDDVERVGGDVVLREIRATTPLMPVASGARDRRMRQIAPRSAARTRRRADGTRSGGRSSRKSLTATSRSRSRSYARNTGPSVPAPI